MISSILKFFPLVGGIVFAIFLLINVVPEFVTTGDVSLLVKAFGEIATGGQTAIAHAVDEVKSGNNWAYLNLIGGVLLTASVLNIFVKIADFISSFESPLSQWALALVIFSLVSIAYNGAVHHEFIAPFSGILYLLQSVPTLAAPVSPIVNRTFEYCNGSPFC